MSEVFIGFINRSLAAGWLILALILLRPLLKKAPKWLMPAFWALVGIRLVCPFSFTSALSLIPSAEVLSPANVQFEAPALTTGIKALDEAVNPILAESLSPAPGASVNPLYVWVHVLGILWVVIGAVLLLYAVVQYILLKRRLSVSLLVEKDIYESNAISSPFLLGFIHPGVYLPVGLEEPARFYIIAHEKSHLKRCDHWTKAFGYGLTCLYWFHPLIWVGYWLFCRDLELACDDQVLRSLEPEQRIEYSQTLLTMAAKKSHGGCPLAFGETGVKERIRTALAYKQTKVWITIGAVLLCGVLGVCFLTNPISVKETLHLVSTDGDWITYAINTEKEVTVHTELWQNGVCVFHESSEPLPQRSQLILHLHGSNREDGSYLFTFQLDTDTQAAAHLTTFTLEQSLIGWSTVAWNPHETVSLTTGKSVVLLGRFFDVAYGSARSYGNCRVLTEEPTLYQTAPCALVVRIEIL